jgi:magnesium-transporting ATPase (P-type)
MTVNLSAIFIVMVTGFTLGESPFNVIQLLWINMIMDTLAALALATEPPNDLPLSNIRMR